MDGGALMGILSSNYQLIEMYVGGSTALQNKVPDSVIMELTRRPQEQTVIVNAAAYVFSLTSPYGYDPHILSGNIYAVYNQAGRMLYQVAGHNGIWGRNALDAQLVFGSQPWEYYFVNAGGGIVYGILRGEDPIPLGSSGATSTSLSSGNGCTLILSGSGTVYVLAKGTRTSSISAAIVMAQGKSTVITGAAPVSVIISSDSWIYLQNASGTPSTAILPGDKVASGLYFTRASSPDTAITV